MLAQDANFSYVAGENVQQLRRILDDPHCYQGNKMQQANTLLNKLQDAIAARVQQEKTETLAKVDERWQRLTGMAEFEDLDHGQQAQLQKPFTSLKQHIANQTLIAVIRDLLRRFDETQYPGLLRQMVEWAQPDPDEGKAPPVLVVKETVSLRNLYVPFQRPWLENEVHVEQYLQALKLALQAEIKKGKNIQI